MTKSFTSSSVSALRPFLAFNLIGFTINFICAFNHPVESLARSVFLSGFNLCLLIANTFYLYTYLSDYLESIQYKTLEKLNREALKEHNECLVTTPINSEEETESEEIVEDDSTSSEEENPKRVPIEVEEPIVQNRFKMTMSVGVKDTDDILSPEDFNNLNFD